MPSTNVSCTELAEACKLKVPLTNPVKNNNKKIPAAQSSLHKFIYDLISVFCCVLF